MSGILYWSDAEERRKERELRGSEQAFVQGPPPPADDPLAQWFAKNRPEPKAPPTPVDGVEARGSDQSFAPSPPPDPTALPPETSRDPLDQWMRENGPEAQYRKFNVATRLPETADVPREQFRAMTPEQRKGMIARPEQRDPTFLEPDHTPAILAALPLAAGVGALGAGATLRGALGAVAKDAALQVPQAAVQVAAEGAGQTIGGDAGQAVGGLLGGGAGAVAASRVGARAGQAMTEAERMAAENVAVRQGALADQLASVRELAGEQQPGMAGFVSRRAGEIEAEQAARSPAVGGPVAPRPAVEIARKTAEGEAGEESPLPAPLRAALAEPGVTAELPEPIQAVLAGQRGAALNPLPAISAKVGAAFDTAMDKVGHKVGALADRAAGAATFRYNDPLSQFKSAVDETVNLDTVLARTRNAQNSAAHTAAETARSLQADFTPWESEAINKFLVAKDELATLRSGLPVSERPLMTPVGTPVLDVYGKPVMRATTEADLLQDIAAAENRFMYNGKPSGPNPINTKQRLQHEEAKFRAWSDETLRRLKDNGALDAEFEGRPDWVHHIVEKYGQDDGSMFGGIRKAPAVPKPNAAKERTGSTAAIVKNPYQTGAVADYQARRLEQAKLFETDVLHRNDLTDQIVADPSKFDPKQHALFSFNRQDAGAEALEGALAEKQIRDGLGNYKVLPKTLVEGLKKAVAPSREQTKFEDVLTIGGRVAKNMNLMLSPSFQISQWPADYATHLYNLKVREWPEFTKKAIGNVKELWREYGRVLGVNQPEGKSDLLESLRNRGLSTEVAESLFDRAPRETPEWVKNRGDGFKKVWEAMAGSERPAAVVSETSLPRHLRPEGSVLENAGRAWGGFKEGLGALGQIRETALKKATAEVLMARKGAEKVSPDAAVNWANRISGSYWKSSDSGRTAGKVALFAKWYAEQTLRLTRDIAKNPATGRSDWAGLTSGPAPKILAMGLLTAAVNSLTPERRKAAANLASRDATAIVLDVNEDGDPLVMVPDTLNKVAATMMGTGKDVATGEWGKAARDTIDSVAQRAATNPLIGAPLLLYRRDAKREENMTTEEKAALVKKQGGFMGSPTGQAAADLFTGGPGRLMKALNTEDTSSKALGILRTTGLAFPGAPVFRRDKHDRLAEERARLGPEMWQQFIDNVRPGPGKTTPETIQRKQAAIRWLQEHGVTEASMRAAVTRGLKNAKEAEDLTREDAQDRVRARMRLGMSP